MHDLIDRYARLNESYGEPFIFYLTRRGFFSEVNNVLNAVIWGLAMRRRLIVDQSAFDYRWTDFFTADLPTADDSVRATVSWEWTCIDNFHPFFWTIRGWAWGYSGGLVLPDLGIEGSLFAVKRLVTDLFTAPRYATGESPPQLYAAFHVRRGDKLAVELGKEGDDIALPVYVDLLDRLAPEAGDVFVMTDDYRTVEAARAATWRNVHSLCESCERGYDQHAFDMLAVAVRRAAIERLLREVTIAAASDVFIGMYKSNVSRFVALRHAKPERCFSIDGSPYWWAG